MALITISFLIALLVAFAAGENNVMLTGEILPTDGRLTYGNATFIMQGDCNLVLYNGGFQSNTHGRGVDCTLTLNDVGQLVIKSGNGRTVWISSGQPNEKGRYAAVLRPDNRLAIYGPSLWSTTTAVVRDKAGFLAEPAGNNIPMVRNVLFSSQVLYGGGALETGDYELQMREDCNLVLTKRGSGVVWESGTAGEGRYCFLRLGHRGQLSVVDDRYGTVWASSPVGRQEGDYVLLLQTDGQAVVYGPLVWITVSDRLSYI